MGINMGAFFSPLVCGSLGDTGNISDSKYGFLAAAIGMVISTLSFEILKNKHLKGPDGELFGMPLAKMGANTQGVILGSIVLIFALLNFQLIVKGIFGVDAVNTDGTLAHTIANIDLVAYLIYASIFLMPIIILSDKSLTKMKENE